MSGFQVYKINYGALAKTANMPSKQEIRMIESCINLYTLEDLASKHLDSRSYDYYRGGAADEITLRENISAYARIKLRPRMLQDVSKIDTETTILNCKISSPIMVAPMAFQMLADIDGEEATAKAAAASGKLMTVSTLATRSLEQIRAASDGHLWFQLYVYREKSITRDLVKRAEQAGYKAIVMTVDSPVLGKREKDIKNRFSLPGGIVLENLKEHQLENFPETDDNSGLAEYIDSLYDQSLTWKDLEWIASITDLPVLVKGILREDDALAAIKHGAGGIVVSNHGGRQLDTTLSTIEALPEVVKAVGGKVPVIVDGGIRRGTDILKAIALGASAIYLGRPVLWGLSIAGQRGVEYVLDLLQKELENAMTLSGCKNLDEVTGDLIYKHNQ